MPKNFNITSLIILFLFTVFTQFSGCSSPKNELINLLQKNIDNIEYCTTLFYECNKNYKEYEARLDKEKLSEKTQKNINEYKKLKNTYYNTLTAKEKIEVDKKEKEVSQKYDELDNLLSSR